MILRLHIFISALILISAQSLYAQELEMPQEVEDSVQKPKHPSKRAALYSAIVPGGGQVYNHLLLPKTSRRKWNVYWKVPLIYGAIGGSTYMLIDKQIEIGNLKKEYRARVGLSGGETFPEYQTYDNPAILQLHQRAQSMRDMFILTTLLAYAINVLDATVEAHFINFDVSDDLSFRLEPAATPNFGIGLSMALKFR